MTHRQKVKTKPTKPNQQLNSAGAFMDRISEKVNNYIFREFRPIFWYFSGIPSKFREFFAATDTTIYFLKTHIDIFLVVKSKQSLKFWVSVKS